MLSCLLPFRQAQGPEPAEGLPAEPSTQQPCQPFALAEFSVVRRFLVRTVRARSLQVVSSDQFWATERAFQDAHRAREGHLPLKDQTANYDTRYDALVRRLSAIGTLVEGSGDADFSTYRYVPPSGVITVVCETETIFRTQAPDAALAAIHDTPNPFMVTFDAGSYIAVLPDGRVIGFSDSEDLTQYTHEPYA